jgi:hypothetical protein
MKLLPAGLVAEAAAGHEHHDHASGHASEAHEHHHEHPGEGHAHEAPGGIEWEDDMVDVNRATTPANTRWKLIDRSTGAENTAIDCAFASATG